MEMAEFDPFDNFSLEKFRCKVWYTMYDARFQHVEVWSYMGKDLCVCVKYLGKGYVVWIEYLIIKCILFIWLFILNVNKKR